MAGKGVSRIVHGSVSTGKGYTTGPWRTSVSRGPVGDEIQALHHYGTKMLEWTLVRNIHGVPSEPKITGTWTGWGSVSDQTGVNAALRTLGSNLRYSRDTKGGGPRVNPRRRRGRRNATMSRVLAVNAISPSVPMWMR